MSDIIFGKIGVRLFYFSIFYNKNNYCMIYPYNAVIKIFWDGSKADEEIVTLIVGNDRVKIKGKGLKAILEKFRACELVSINEGQWDDFQLNITSIEVRLNEANLALKTVGLISDNNKSLFH